METKILIALAVFSISILLAQSMYINPVNAQLAFTTATISYSGNTDDMSNCTYVSSTEVWCTSTSGIKIINPTSQSVSSTLYSGITIQDIACSSSNCYSWHNGDTATANLTQWSISSHDFINSTTFSMSGGANVGRQMDIVIDGSDSNLVVPSSASSCAGAGATNLKGICIINTDTFTPARFISSSDTGPAAIVFGIKWSENLNTVSAPTQNTVLVFFQDTAGTRTWKIINLNSAGSTFAATQLCSATASSLGATETQQVYVYSQNYYVPVDAGSTGLYAELPITSATCTQTNTYTTLWDNPTGLVTDGEFFYTSSYDGATGKSAFQVYNSSSSALATYNITASSSKTRNTWYHSSEGEVQVLADNRLIVFKTQEGSNPQDEFCDLPENFNILSCVLERGDTTPLVGASELIGNSTNTIVCQLGLIECTNFVPNNPDTKTNGVGYLILFVGLGIMIGIFWVASRGDLGSIPTFVWFIATLSIVGLIVAFDLIDATILIVAIIAIIVLATAKVKGVFGSSGLFAGDT